jgi:GNAT superfamily N-acetyltransferase
MPVRAACDADLAAMVSLSAASRRRLAQYSPVFWRAAADADARQRAWFQFLLGQPETIALVFADGEQIDGFALARLTAAPPVYAPGGPVSVLDDFCLTDDAAWPTVGAALLDAVEAAARQRGAPLTVVVCAHLDADKRAWLAARGFALTSEWWVRLLSEC